MVRAPVEASGAMVPVEASGAIVPVDRPMTPGPQFGSIPVRRAIMMPPVKFRFEPGPRAIKMTPGMIAGAAVTDAVPINMSISGPIPFLELSASIPTTVAASFALGPGITRKGHNKSNQYNADDNDLFLHDLPPCSQD